MSAPRGDHGAGTTVTLVEGVEVSPDHLIGGERVPSPQTFEDRSPLDWSWKLADIARGDARDGPTPQSPPPSSPSGRGRTSVLTVERSCSTASPT